MSYGSNMMLMGANNSAAVSGPSFFGAYSMYREISPEDPNWTNPGDATNLTTVRDNGTAATDFTAYGDSAGVTPQYVESSAINSKPAFHFRASSNAVGGHLLSAIPGATPGGLRTVVIVGKIDTPLGTYGYFCDTHPVISTTWRRIVGFGAQAASTFGMYSNGSSFVNAGAVDTSPHVWVAVFENNNHRLYKDGTLAGTDATSSSQPQPNSIIGRSQDAGVGSINGLIAYYAEFDGDLTAEAGYADWVADLMDYYGIA